MSAIGNVAFLDLFRDHLDEIRELSGSGWTDFVRRVQPLLMKIAISTDPQEVKLLIDELIASALATPAAETVGRLTVEARRRQQLTLDVARGGRTPDGRLGLEDNASSATTGTAGGLLEWMTARDQCGYRSIPVLFATDRKPTGEENPNKFFSGDRGELRYGTVHVSIPDLHRTGRIERPWTFFPESPKTHVTLLELELSRPVTFLDGVNSALKRADMRKILIFVHGYHVPFADAARSLAQLTFDLNFTGVCILYSWPSTGSFFGYTRDEANAAWTREHFLEMLGTLAGLKDPAEYHLLGHSMGNRVVFQGLQLLDEMRFGQVILAAPDEDAGTLENQMPRFVGRAERNTLYASRKDLALWASSWIHGYERGGQVGASRLDSIDASAVNFSQFGHSYFHEQRELLADIFLLVEHGIPPARRPLIRPAPDGVTWLFQP
jgi:esterase/lipase superfamily enzyme